MINKDIFDILEKRLIDIAIKILNKWDLVLIH